MMDDLNKDLKNFILDFKDRVDNRTLPKHVFDMPKQDIVTGERYIHIDRAKNDRVKSKSKSSFVNIGETVNTAYIEVSSITPEAIYHFRYEGYNIQWKLTYRSVPYIQYEVFIPEYKHSIRNCFVIDEYDCRTPFSAEKIVIKDFEIKLQELRTEWD